MGPSHDDVEMVKLRQAVAVAWQHHRQQQVRAACDVTGPRHDEWSEEETRPLNYIAAPSCDVNDSQSNVTSGRISDLPPVRKSHCGQYAAVPAAVEGSMSGMTSELQYPSVQSLGSSDIERRVLQLNGEYDKFSVACTDDRRPSKAGDLRQIVIQRCTTL